jgi:putative phosphoesterase
VSRVGLIADVHGNLFALEVVLGELAREGVERVICLGDVAALGPYPGACVARLRELGCPCVLGNTDEWLLAGVPGQVTPERAPLFDLTQWAAAQLSPDDRAWLGALPLMLESVLGEERRLLCFHGSPRSHEDVIAATTPEHELTAMLSGRRADVLAGGHTHVQLVRRVGARHLINPGSVGLPGTGPGTPDLPVNRDVGWAEYAVLSAGDGRLSIELRRVPLDVDAMVCGARARGMPWFAWWSTLYRDVSRSGG